MNVLVVMNQNKYHRAAKYSAIIFISILFSKSTVAQYILIDSLMRDTLNAGAFVENSKELINRYLNDVKIGKRMYPFDNFSYVKLYTLNSQYFETEDVIYLSNVYDSKSKKLGKSVEKPGYYLTFSQTMRLLNIMNNPLNFDWGFIGTPFPKYGFVFYGYEHEILAYFDINKNLTQINLLYPESYLTKSGSLNEKASLELKNLILDVLDKSKL